MTKRNIPIVGMACAACAANVERKLSSLDGVKSAAVSLPTRTAMVEWDENIITPEDMKRELNSIGFDMVTESGRSVEEIERREYKLLRRRVVLSWLAALAVMSLSMGWIDVGGRDAANQISLILAVANAVYCGREFYVRA